MPSGLVQTLRYYWKTSLAVIASAAITTAVLAGALVVGDSMRHSLRSLALERLGGIDDALLSESFFRSDLAEELGGEASFASAYDKTAVAILLRGSARAPESGRRAASVQIQGVDDRFAELFAGGTDSAPTLAMDRAEGQRFPSVVVNASLARELAVKPGDDVVLALARPSDVPRESLMGSTDASDVVRTVRLSVREVLPDRGIGRFGLDPSQRITLNAFVPIATLQRALDQRGRVNAMFAQRAGSEEAAGVGGAFAAFEQALDNRVRLEDLGLELRVGPDRDPRRRATTPSDVVSIESREIVLRPHIETELLQWAQAEGVEALPVSSYLANRTSVVGVERGGRALPYSTVSAMSLDHPAYGELTWLAGAERTPSETEVVINAWAARDLRAEVGDVLRLEYWEVGDLEELIPRSVDLRLSGVVELSGLAGDPSLTPPFPGVHDADDMADWEPTFPVDLDQITDRDEEYWDLHRATPKLFVHPDAARTLWASRFGVLSSVRLRAEGVSGEDLEQRVQAGLLQRLDRASAGLAPLAVKESALRGAGGATDFGGLFIGFSMFLIVAAALLAALFFRLGVEQRAREIGLRLGVGFRPRSVLRWFLAEGLSLALVGCVLGVGLAIGYARLMIAGLESRWAAAIGMEQGTTGFLSLHVVPATLAIGAIGAFVIVALAVWRTVRRLTGTSPVSLLRGETGTKVRSTSRRPRALWVFVAAVPLTVACLVGSSLVDATQAAPLFFGAGACLLVAGLALFALWLARDRGLMETPGLATQLRMARSNAGLYPGRSLLAVGLVAAATFVIVAVGAYGHRFGDHVGEKDSGAGGFSVMAHSDVPLFHDLSSQEGRFELGFSAEEGATFEGREVFALREVPGDDVSCLNLYQPERPRLLGVSESFVERGGFTFQQLDDEGQVLDNPWQRLHADLGPDVVPAIGDYNSVLWILKSGVGKDVEIENGLGEPIKVRIVGLLRKSIFQRELLIAEDQLLRHFPKRDGYQSFLFSAHDSSQNPDVLTTLLEARLDRYGLDAVGTAEQLEAFQAVENTYLGTFRALGGLGLLLGTLGLAVVLLRSVLERTGELALLRAVGFRRAFLGGLVVAENALLLLSGLALGATAALLAVYPHLTGGAAEVPWSALSLTLLAVLGIGLTAAWFAARAAMRVVVLDGLRGQG